MSDLVIDAKRFDSTSELARFLEAEGYKRFAPMKSLWRNKCYWAHIALLKSGAALVIQPFYENQ